MAQVWPLTGRDAELRAITTSLQAGGAGIVLAGPAGVGKTRLARDALAGRAGRDGATLWAQGSTAARPLPLGAFAGMVDLEPVEPARAVRDAVDQVGRDAHGVLVVDDAHLLDELSALVVHRLITERRASVVVTLRDDAPAPDPVTALWKDDHLPRLDLAPLDADTTAALVAEVLGGPVESRSARRLWQLTEGIPLFLRHLLAGEVSARRMTPESGIWRWSARPGITPALTTVLEQQIGSLDADVRDVIDLVALAEPIDLATLRQLTTTAAVEQAEDRGLVRIDVMKDPVRARLAHPLYGEVRRTAMGQARARRMRGQIATALGATADPVARAVLIVDSDLEPQPDVLLAGAQRALGYFDLPLAERLARAAAECGGWDARLLQASILSWLSRGDEAEEALRALADTAPNDPRLALVHLHRTGNLLWTVADADRAGEALAAAESVGAAEPVGSDIIALRAAYDAAVGRPASALVAGRAALAATPTDLGRILAASALTLVAAAQGSATLLDEAARAGGLTGDAPPAVVPAFGLVDLQVLGHRLAGRPAIGSRLAARMQATAAELPGPARLMGLVLAGHAALAAGRPVEAITPLEEAWSQLSSSGHEFRFRCRTLLVLAHGQTGRADRAGLLVADLAREQHPAFRLLAPDDLIARAWADAADGAVTTAVEHARAAVRLAEEQESPAYEVLAWQTVLQLGGAVPGESLARLSITGPRLDALRVHAHAIATRDGAALVGSSEEWEQLGDLLAAGDAAAQAAVVFRADGRQGSALSATARAERLVALSGAVTPALAAALQPLPLSAREREIATLAARGLSNRAIAEQLTLSVRTVEGHVYRVCAKLGISDRRGLADILGAANTSSRLRTPHAVVDPTLGIDRPPQEEP